MNQKMPEKSEKFEKEKPIILANSIEPLLRASAKFIDIVPSGVSGATLDTIVKANEIKDDNG